MCPGDASGFTTSTRRPGSPPDACAAQYAVVSSHWHAREVADLVGVLPDGDAACVQRGYQRRDPLGVEAAVAQEQVVHRVFPPDLQIGATLPCADEGCQFALTH